MKRCTAAGGVSSTIYGCTPFPYHRYLIVHLLESQVLLVAVSYVLVAVSYE